jgi:hypothetical protein
MWHDRWHSATEICSPLELLPVEATSGEIGKYLNQHQFLNTLLFSFVCSGKSSITAIQGYSDPKSCPKRGFHSIRPRALKQQAPEERTGSPGCSANHPLVGRRVLAVVGDGRDSVEPCLLAHIITSRRASAHHDSCLPLATLHAPPRRGRSQPLRSCSSRPPSPLCPRRPTAPHHQRPAPR